MNSAIFVAVPLLAFTGALMFVLPYLSPRRYFFAITVPPDFPSSEPARAVLRRYHGQLTIFLLISIAAIWPLSEAEPDMALVLGMLLPALGGMVFYLLGRNRVRRYSVSPGAVREAEISTEQDHLPRWIALALPPFVAPLAAAAYLRAHWDEIPQRFPVHFDMAGTPNQWAEKTARGVFGPLLAEAGLMLFMLLLSLAAFYGARRGPQRLAVLRMMVAAMYLMAYVVTVVSLMAVIHVTVAIHLAPVALFTIGVLVWCYKMARDPKMPVDNTPDEFWRLGSIYYNPADPAVFVQKRIGFGYTLNLGNPAAWVAMGILAAAVAAFVLVARL
jgi:uncharacterized membrane protein